MAQFRLQLSLFCALVAATPSQGGWWECMGALLSTSWFNPEVISPASDWRARAQKRINKHPELQPTWQELTAIDEIAGNWLISSVQGVERLPKNDLTLLTRAFARPGFHFILERTAGPISLRVREKDISIWKDLLPATGIVGSYFHFPFRQTVILGGAKSDWSGASGILLRSMAARFRYQLRSLNPAYFARADELYASRMEAVGISGENYRKLKRTLEEHRISAYSMARVRDIQSRVQRRFVSELQAWSAHEYFCEGVRLYFEDGDRLNETDNELWRQLDSVFGLEPVFFPSALAD